MTLKITDPAAPPHQVANTSDGSWLLFRAALGSLWSCFCRSRQDLPKASCRAPSPCGVDSRRAAAHLGGRPSLTTSHGALCETLLPRDLQNGCFRISSSRPSTPNDRCGARCSCCTLPAPRSTLRQLCALPAVHTRRDEQWPQHGGRAASHHVWATPKKAGRRAANIKLRFMSPDPSPQRCAACMCLAISGQYPNPFGPERKCC